MNELKVESVRVGNPLDEEESSSSSDADAATSPREEDTTDAWSSSWFSHTPVTIYQEIREVPGAPRREKRCMMYLCRRQISPPACLEEEWPLETYGSWGYVFKYELGELCLFQLARGESLGPSSIMTVLNAEDWGVMKMVLRMAESKKNKDVNGEKSSDREDDVVDLDVMKTMLKMTDSDQEDDPDEDDTDKEESGYGSEEEKEVNENGKRVHGESPPGEKRPRRGIQFDDDELAKLKIILGAIWSSRSSGSGRWMTQASVRSGSDGMRSADIFALERFNPDCGLFRSVLVVPAMEWFKRMTQIKERISLLFQSCRCWKESVVVRKTLIF